jgi:predicted amidohydrolase
MTLTGFSMNIDKISETETNGKTLEKFKKMAKENNIAIVFGIVIEDNKKAKNRVYFIDNNGVVLNYYDKIHPFSFAGEDKYFNGGDMLSFVNFKSINIGLSICYDLRFPELYSALSSTCDVIINIANWPAKRIYHWNTLLKARAIENQIFMIGVNRTGIDGNSLEYVESSNIFNANGEILTSKQFYIMKIINIDLEEQTKFIESFNTTQDRKNDLYKGLLCH